MTVEQTPESPFSYNLFRALWLAGIASNIGTAMHGIGSAWLITSLSASPIIISLLQTATSLSLVIFALPGGALADIFDRRKTLLITQYFQLVITGILGLLALTNNVTPSIVLGFTFLLGIGAAISLPALTGAGLELVSRSAARHAITLSGVSINIGLAAGPIVGGFVVSSLGPWAVFIVNAISFSGLIIFFHKWKREYPARTLPPERVVGAMRAVIRYVQHSPQIHSLFVRDVSFSVFASALMSLLPLFSRNDLKLDSTQFGILIGCFGIGAIIGGFVILPKILHKLSIDWKVNGAIVVFAGMMVVLAFKPSFVLLCLAMIMGGIAQITIMSNLSYFSYKSTSKWVGIRVLSIHIVIFQAGFTAGSVLWGFVANQFGISNTLLIASLGLAIGLVTATRYRLSAHQEVDMSPSMHWPMPQMSGDVRDNDNPVLVKVEYQIDLKRSQEFEAVMRQLKDIRLKDGAVDWGFFRDTADPSIYVETFLEESWTEHLRHHERVTIADKELEEKVRSHHIGKTRPKVSHLISVAEEKEKGGV